MVPCCYDLYFLLFKIAEGEGVGTYRVKFYQHPQQPLPMHILTMGGRSDVSGRGGGTGCIKLLELMKL